MNWPTVAAFALYLAFDALLIAGTGYAVFVLGFSGWWFLLAMVLSCGNRMPETDCDCAPSTDAVEAP